MQLHWLPIEQRIVYKIILVTFEALNGLAPQYITDMISYYKPSRCLRSSNSSLLNETRFSVNSYGGRALSVSSPKIWNKLSSSLRASIDLSEFEFKSKLKTHLFDTAYNVK